MVVHFRVFDGNENLIYSGALKLPENSNPEEEVKNFVNTTFSHYKPLTITGIIVRKEKGKEKVSAFAIGMD